MYAELYRDSVGIEIKIKSLMTTYCAIQTIAYIQAQLTLNLKMQLNLQLEERVKWRPEVQKCTVESLKNGE